ncbi:LAETG motif-containing sortase-dependent surface protein [Streptomyces sp. NPDC049597]|uniref:LAETG motif-containing sortase-dependent surface protein n=1 Tax=Streptomyces sp. NPDC049597 TaxID=3155276 RepID=UPI00343B2BCF
MSVARRPLLTATAAGTLLCALWFVPSANATAERAGAQQAATGSAADARTSGGQELRLAETGSVDTTPYVIGGTAFLVVGAGFVAYSVRRSGEYAV